MSPIKYASVSPDRHLEPGRCRCREVAGVANVVCARDVLAVGDAEVVGLIPEFRRTEAARAENRIPYLDEVVVHRDCAAEAVMAGDPWTGFVISERLKPPTT